MPIKTLLFAGALAILAVGALFQPMLGVTGYMLHYMTGPERQWWADALRGVGFRYSLILAVATAVGMFFSWGKLRLGRLSWDRQEKLVLLFLALIWVSMLLGEETVGRYTQIDHPTVKFLKIVIFAMMMTHIVTDLKKLDWLLWVFVAGALILGWQAYDTPRSQFVSGRLNSVGGPDFAESNALAAYFGAMLPIVGVQFLRSRLVGKIVTFLAGGLAANAIVLTRSRGGFLGVAVGGVVAACFAPRRHRAKIIVALVLAGLGGFWLADQRFIDRMATITHGAEERDASAESRLDFARAGKAMFMDHPLGIGAGNWYQTVGKYNKNLANRDAHDSFVKCAVELGVQGLAVYLLVLASALWMLRRIAKDAASLPTELHDHFAQLALALTVSIAVLVTCSLTMTLLYMEGMWWMLLLPVCLQRALERAKEQALLAPEAAVESVRAAPAPRRRRRAPAALRR